MRLALVGDIHLYRLACSPLRLLGKRLLGQTNLWLNRRRRFRRELAQPLVEQLRALAPDQVLFSGDFTTTSLPGEFADAAALVREVAQFAPVALVPGNHDRYTFASARQQAMEKAFGELMPAMPSLTPLTNCWQLLRLDSATPRWLSSRGRLGTAQMEALDRSLRRLTAAQGLIVLNHYALGNPPQYKPASWEHQLQEQDELLQRLTACPASTLYVHGHVHQPWRWQRSEKLLDLNTGAPCLCRKSSPYGQGFWEIELPDSPELSRIVFYRHVLQPGVGDDLPRWVREPG